MCLLKPIATCFLQIQESLNDQVQNTYVRTLVDSVLSRQTPADSRGQRQSLNRHGTHLRTHKWTHGQKTEEQVNIYTMLCTYALSYEIGFKNYISIYTYI